jgi:hypothetical protein
MAFRRRGEAWMRRQTSSIVRTVASFAPVSHRGYTVCRRARKGQVVFAQVAFSPGGTADLFARLQAAEGALGPAGQVGFRAVVSGSCAPCCDREDIMDAATTTRLEVVPLTKHIGAEIRGIDLRDDLDGDTVKAIRKAWLDHLVLVFRGQQFGQEDLVRATAISARSGRCRGRQSSFPRGSQSCCPTS